MPVVIGIALAGAALVLLPKEPTIWNPSKNDYTKVQFEDVKGKEEEKKDGKPKVTSMKKIDEKNKKAGKEKQEEKPQSKPVDTTEQDKELT